MIPAKKFYMIRHGETEANAKLVMAGSTDSPLTAKGRDQARAVQDVVVALDEKPRTILHSHLSRARDTAAIINEALQVDMMENTDLAEMHAGELEGVSYAQCHDFHHHWADPPGGETYAQFFERIARGKNAALALPGPILIVCHGGVMKGFGRMQGLPMAGKFRNCHLHQFDPAPHYDVFPWETMDFDLCPTTKTVLKNTETVYHLDRMSMAQNDVIAL